MGHVLVLDDSPAQLALTHYSCRLWHELAAELPPDAEYSATGTIWVAADAEEFYEIERKRTVYNGAGIATEVLDQAALAEAEPNLRVGLAGGLLIPDDALVYAPCAARWLLERARDRGAEVRAGEVAASLSEQGIQLRDGTVVEAAATVNATGAWAPDLTPGIEVRRRKGHLVITDRYPGFLRRPLVELGYLKSAHSLTADSVAFNVQPRPTGQVLIGSSRQFGAEDTGVDGPMLSRMLQRAGEYMPRLGELSAIRAWTGFRAATPDKLPLIGPCPGQSRLYLATGHEGLGITTSLATGKLIADQLLGRASAIPIAPYLPGRSAHA
jgi:glycine/D-amino acid oxidase-like deaminating enzyme